MCLITRTPRSCVLRFLFCFAKSGTGPPLWVTLGWLKSLQCLMVHCTNLITYTPRNDPFFWCHIDWTSKKNSRSNLIGHFPRLMFDEQRKSSKQTPQPNLQLQSMYKTHLSSTCNFLYDYRFLFTVPRTHALENRQTYTYTHIHAHDTHTQVHTLLKWGQLFETCTHTSMYTHTHSIKQSCTITHNTHTQIQTLLKCEQSLETHTHTSMYTPTHTINHVHLYAKEYTHTHTHIHTHDTHAYVSLYKPN